MSRSWADIRIDMHRAVLGLRGGVRHPRAGYVEVLCEGADMHDLGPCDPPCNVCDSGLSPRCPDCGAAV